MRHGVPAFRILADNAFHAVANVRTTLLGSSAQERAWEMDGTHGLLRITLAPACGGKGYYAVLRAATDDASRSALEKFVGSLHATRPVSPVCAELE